MDQWRSRKARSLGCRAVIARGCPGREAQVRGHSTSRTLFAYESPRMGTGTKTYAS